MTEPEPVAKPAAYQPYVPPPSTVPQAVMRPLGLLDPLRWLRAGAADFGRHRASACSMGRASGAWRWCWGWCFAAGPNT
jgi:hypothetical protein